MAGETAGVAAPSAASDLPTGPTLADFLEDPGEAGESFDEGTPQAQGSEDAAAAQAAERPDGGSVGAGAPEGAGQAARAGAQPVDATGTTPDATTQPGAIPAGDAAQGTPADPLEGSAPFNYTVNGQPRGVGHITELKDGQGGIVTPEGLNFLRQRLSERDVLFERDRERNQQLQAYERLSGWATKDQTGAEHIVSGLDGLTELRVQLASTQAENEVLSGLLEDPRRMVALLEPKLGPDGQPTGEFGVNAERLRLLALEAKDMQRDREKMVRDVFAKLRQGAPAGPAQPANTARPQVDLAKHGPQIIKNAAGSLDASLSAEDRSFLANQLPFYLRQATEQDRQQNALLTVGQPIVDYAFQQLVQSRANASKVTATAAQAATAAAAAAADNQRRLAASQSALRPNGAGGAPQNANTPAATKEAPKPSKDEQAWSLMEALHSHRGFRTPL